MVGAAARHVALFVAATLATAIAVALPVLVLMPQAVGEQGALAVLNDNLADLSLPSVILPVLVNGAMQGAAFLFLRKHQAPILIAAVFTVWSAFSWWIWLGYL